MDRSTALIELKKLKPTLEGDLFTDNATRILYATDASAYREMPVAVIRPKNKSDIRKLVLFAGEHQIPLIPRGAGTSLAGQVVGNGIVVDITKYMNRIIEINAEERWVRVEPGVVLDELNIALEPYGLFFGPETSTSNRCVIGGMVGNNSCGAHSLIYGSTRDHTLELEVILSDGTEAVFGELTKEEFEKKQVGNRLENKIYRNIAGILSPKANRNIINQEYPDPLISRRNTGYAIDLLLRAETFIESNEKFNFCKLLAGSEGTLAFTTEIKLNLVPLPPKTKGLVCVHFKTLEEAFEANLIALDHKPGAVELMDNIILQQTKDNLEQAKNRFFVQGDPAAILIIEFARETKEEILTIATAMEAEMRAAGYGYHFPVIFGTDINRVWTLRKAGLGLLSNMPGDAKPVSLVEDTAVNPKLLPQYLAEFKKLLKKYDLTAVYHAHIATGELHLRPVLDLKKTADLKLFYMIARETALLVKKYRGSLSGEHGDGRLRGEFIPLMVGEHNYRLLKEIKNTWDPHHIFNPGKITDTPSITTSLRYEPEKMTREVNTIFDFSADMGMMRAVEKCNGSGDCRKTEIVGGTMCPSYMATRNENDTTRARANTLREFLTHSPKNNPFNHKEIYNVMDLCLSCKGCKSECPSSVDMARYKAEFLQHWYDEHGIPLRTRAIAYISSLNRLGMIIPGLTNFFFTNRFTSGLLKRMLGFAPKRSIPLLYRFTLNHWLQKNLTRLQNGIETKGSVYLFVDEFTEYNDTEIGIKAVELLTRLGYTVKTARHKESGRTFLSKGLVRKAQQLANFNVQVFKNLITQETPLIGIEPSGILSFRDEYPDLVDQSLKEDARRLAKHALMFDEFFERELNAGRIIAEQFTNDSKKIKLHGHCHQKSLASIAPTKVMLSLPANFEVEEIKSGCCGMAGSFGYEAEHYDVSMQVGELVLFPAIRKTPEEVIIAAPGTSCRHQIKDGTGRKAFHPIEIMYDALISDSQKTP
ncbi:MAG: FAD-binding protein [Bacteroidales bacterium]|nr:FAD-binding protein [Bacteroidales bacterium]